MVNAVTVTMKVDHPRRPFGNDRQRARQNGFSFSNELNSNSNSNKCV